MEPTPYRYLDVSEIIRTIKGSVLEAYRICPIGDGPNPEEYCRQYLAADICAHAKGSVEFTQSEYHLPGYRRYRGSLVVMRRSEAAALIEKLRPFVGSRIRAAVQRPLED